MLWLTACILGVLAQEQLITIDDIYDRYGADAFKTAGTISLTGPIKSFTVSTTWNDQGWGNMKGAMRAVLVRSGTEVYGVDLFGVAPHASTYAEKTFSSDTLFAYYAREGDDVVIGYNVGGGGGHSLSMTGTVVSVEYANQATTFKPPMYALNGFNLDFCMEGYDMITDVNACKEASEAIGVEYDHALEDEEKCVEKNPTNKWLGDHTCHMNISGYANKPGTVRVYDCHWNLASFLCKWNGPSSGNKDDDGPTECLKINDMPDPYKKRKKMCKEGGCVWKKSRSYCHFKAGTRQKKKKCHKIKEEQECIDRTDCIVAVKRVNKLTGELKKLKCKKQ